MKRDFATFANFTCRRGALELIDYAEDLIIPAFTRDTLIRKYGHTRYYFYKTLLEILEVADTYRPAIYGHFVKDTELIREQFFDRTVGFV
jgi:hypothetical protein